MPSTIPLKHRPRWAEIRSQGKRIILGNIGETHAQLLEVVGEIAQVVLLRSRPAAHARFAVLEAA